ncbi:MAG: hypothetical protein B6242_01905 [Anaerolineaceae bacterium 4572_78]|nr:MAG: hypothetical protein B6242_01905 [Anaerolineaceae bacterium 4572_78]
MSKSTWFIYPVIFLFALAPRLIGLQQFITADEAKWIYRSAQFWQALLVGNCAETMVTFKPAVTTMWTGGIGLWGYNLFHDNLPFLEFLHVIPLWDVNPAMLAAARLPTILLSCGSIVLIYHLSRYFLGEKTSFLAAILLAFDPLFLAHSRFLHHDALVTLFAVPAVLFAMHVDRLEVCPTWSIIFSGIFAGLSFLTKSPIFFLVPFVLWLFMRNATLNTIHTALTRFVLWACISYLTFFILFPATWLRPIGVPFDIITDALQVAQTSTGTLEQANKFDEDDEMDFQVSSRADLGILYYPVHFGFYISPIVFIGLLLFGYSHATLFVGEGLGRGALSLSLKQLRWGATKIFLIFIISFMIFMTFSHKRSARYILPVFPFATLVASVGWMRCGSNRTSLLVVALAAGQILTVMPYTPYYITYTNPLLGGSFTAPKLIKIGWGEGMDLAGAWLNQQPYAMANIVGADYASTLKPYFIGRVANPTSADLDYVISYHKQRQSLPKPILDYQSRILSPLHTVHYMGIDYAYIYSAPPIYPIDSKTIIAFHPDMNYLPIGQEFTVDVIWHELPPADVMFYMQEGDGNLMAESTYHMLSANVTRHMLVVPDTITSKEYILFINDISLGKYRARQVVVPSHFTSTNVQFGDEIRLMGFNPNLTIHDGSITVDLAFQVTPKSWHDYTLFVHVIDDNGNRLTGYDALPNPSTSQWLKGEVIIISQTVPMPKDLADDDYQLRVGWYHAGTGQDLGDGFELLTMPQ